MAITDRIKGLLDVFMQALRAVAAGFVHTIFGDRSPQSTAELAGQVLAEAFEATLALLASEAGLQDPAQFLLQMKAIHDQIQEGQPNATGETKYRLAEDAIRVAWKAAGGSPTSSALQTIIDVTTSIFHAKPKLDEIVPSDAAHTVGMVNP